MLYYYNVILYYIVLYYIIVYCRNSHIIVIILLDCRAKARANGVFISQTPVPHTCDFCGEASRADRPRSVAQTSTSRRQDPRAHT